MNTERDAHAPGLRGAVERRSAVLVVFLHGLPRWVLLVSVFALLLVAMVATGWLSAAALLVMALFVGWFGYLNWPALDTQGRLLRVAALTVLVAFAVGRALGRF